MRPFLAPLALAGALLLTPAAARDLGQWENVDPAVRAWYRNAQLTEAARQRFKFQNCCDHADVFRTKFKVNKTTGADEWLYLVDGKWKRVPPDIIHWGETAPDKQPTLFIYDGKETCFYPGDGGI